MLSVKRLRGAKSVWLRTYCRNYYIEVIKKEEEKYHNLCHFKCFCLSVIKILIFSVEITQERRAKRLFSGQILAGKIFLSVSLAAFMLALLHIIIAHKKNLSRKKHGMPLTQRVYHHKWEIIYIRNYIFISSWESFPKFIKKWCCTTTEKKYSFNICFTII